MHEFFVTASEYAGLLLNLAALVVIVFGSIEAFLAVLGAMARPKRNRWADNRYVFVRFGHWLVAGLTFQLAADIIETATTSTAEGWADLGRLAAIAVIRTFLSYFLERDMKEVTLAMGEDDNHEEG